MLGSGAWFDADRKRHGEHRLVELMVALDETDLWIELSVHHDVWGQCDVHAQFCRQSMHEYLRRSSLRAKRFDAESSWPFFDISESINSSFLLP